MALLQAYSEGSPTQFETFEDKDAIAKTLLEVGVTYEHWQPPVPVGADDPDDTILEAYQPFIDKLSADRGFKTADIIALNPDNPKREEFRQKFLQEHTHSDDEARFFIFGQGLFYIHAGGRVYSLLCEAGDLINIPKGTKHWFDMGPNPQFKCIRVFTNEEGWVAQFSGSKVATQYPTLEN